MIWEWIKLYLLIGVFLVGLELIILSFGRGRLLESDKTEERIGEVLAFFVEILIWPYELYLFVQALFRIRNGSMSDKECEWYSEGYLRGLELKKKWNKRWNKKTYAIKEDYEK